MTDTISILAGGWSAAGLDLARLPGTVIGVNEAAVLAPRIDIALTMDRLWCEYRWDQLKALARPTFVRRGNNRNCEGSWFGLKVFDCDHTASVFTNDYATLNGGHSGFCALNLAWRTKPRRLVLFGFDHNRGPHGEAYWHPPYPWAPMGATKPGKYAEWARAYGLAARAFADAGTEVLNASLTSGIGAWPKIDPNKVLA